MPSALSPAIVRALTYSPANAALIAPKLPTCVLTRSISDRPGADDGRSRSSSAPRYPIDDGRNGSISVAPGSALTETTAANGATLRTIGYGCGTSERTSTTAENAAKPG